MAKSKLAQEIIFICNSCGETISAWDDGNPYYLDRRGRKHYAYHPDSKREACIGNDSPHLCLSCGKSFMVDSRTPLHQCPKCSSSSICDSYHLQGKSCPFCRKGIFEGRLGGIS